MFIYSTLKQINKKIKGYFDPNHNPTDADKKAFELLESIKVQDFIHHFENQKVNPNVQTQINGLSLLTKAVEISNKSDLKGLNKKQILGNCINLINFLIEKGVDIDIQDKAGRTALIAACHWQQEQVADILIKHGADLDLCTTQSGWITNPLLAAAFKQNYNIMEKLIVAGADIKFVFKLSEQPNGFILQNEVKRYLMKAMNIRLIIYADFLQQKSGNKKNKKLTLLRDQEYQQLIDIC